MKNLSLALIISLLVINISYAAMVHTPFSFSMSRYNIENLEYILVTAENDNEITSEFGLNFLLNEDDHLLWNDNEVTVEITNNGVTQSEVIVPRYLNNYKVLYIPIKDNLLSGDTIKLIGMQVRTYNWTTSSRYIQIDIDGDLVSDIQDGNGYKVSSDEKNNIDPPYSIIDLQYTINDDNSILFTWGNPPDYDYERVTIEKYSTNNSVDSYPIEIKSTTDNSFLDISSYSGDSVTYLFYARDYVSNASEPIVVSFDVVDGILSVNTAYEDPIPDPEPTPNPDPEPANEPSDEESEVDELSRLYNYYKIRYAIKCMPGGVLASEGSSVCLWAKIDLMYAQDITGESSVDISFSDREIDLMSKRVRFSQARYDSNCINIADDPAAYCPALGKALNRVHYFVD